MADVDISLYAAGLTCERAPPLGEFAAAAFEPGKVRLRQYARDFLTGEVPVPDTAPKAEAPVDTGDTGALDGDDAEPEVAGDGGRGDSEDDDSDSASARAQRPYETEKDTRAAAKVFS